MSIRGTEGYTYEWFTNTKSKNIKDQLIEHVSDHVPRMLRECYCEGQLVCEIGNRTYVGYWKKIK